jgi:hypothetical protein
LLAAVTEVRRHTHLGVNGIIDDINRVGAIAAAKACLRPRDRTIKLTFGNQPSAYFLATKRVGKMHLSVEALALDPQWAPLFTREERDEAAQTLSEHEFTPMAEPTSATHEHEPSFGPVLHRRGEFNLDEYLFGRQCSDCDATGRLAAEVRDRRHPQPYRLVRQRLNACASCRTNHPDLVSAYERFDEDAEWLWTLLLNIFAATTEIDDEHLRRFHYLTPDDYEEPEHYELNLESQLDQIRPLCAWRAVRAGCQLGRFMNAYASTITADDDIWLQWRNGRDEHPMAVTVRRTDQARFALALAAQNLLHVSTWEYEERGILWLPADEDLPLGAGHHPRRANERPRRLGRAPRAAAAAP